MSRCRSAIDTPPRCSLLLLRSPAPNGATGRRGTGVVGPAEQDARKRGWQRRRGARQTSRDSHTCSAGLQL